MPLSTASLALLLAFSAFALLAFIGLRHIAVKQRRAYLRSESLARHARIVAYHSRNL